MSQCDEATIGDVFATMRAYKFRFLVSALGITGAATAYAFFGPKTWEASQGMLVRNDASARLDSPGKFHHEDEMKTAQETVLEVAASPTVLEGALREVGRPPRWRGRASWPDEGAIDDLRSSLKLAPPKGAEFGKTEVFYLKVKDDDPRRAIALVSAISDQLQSQFGELRDSMARSMLEELHKTIADNESELTEATDRLSEIEKSVGVDLVALRMLHQSPNSDTDVSRALGIASAEIRQLRSDQAMRAGLLIQLKTALADPQRPIAMPRELLDHQPNLSRLTQGLSETRLRAATHASLLTSRHPLRMAAEREEQTIRDQILTELKTIIASVEADIALTSRRLSELDAQVEGMQARMDKLASERAAYSNQVHLVENRRGLLEQSHRNLADVRASLAAARSNGLITRLGLPRTGPRPLGPGRLTIVLAGILGGLFGGAGLVLLTAPVRRIATHPGIEFPLLAAHSAESRSSQGLSREGLLVTSGCHEPVFSGQGDV